MLCNQLSDQHCVALFGGEVEGRETPLRSHVDKRLGTEQDVGQFLVALLGGQVQRRFSCL